MSKKLALCESHRAEMKHPIFEGCCYVCRIDDEQRENEDRIAYLEQELEKYRECFCTYCEDGIGEGCIRRIALEERKAASYNNTDYSEE